MNGKNFLKILKFLRPFERSESSFFRKKEDVKAAEQLNPADGFISMHIFFAPDERRFKSFKKPSEEFFMAFLRLFSAFPVYHSKFCITYNLLLLLK